MSLISKSWRDQTPLLKIKQYIITINTYVMLLLSKFGYGKWVWEVDMSHKRMESRVLVLVVVTNLNIGPQSH